MDNKFYESFESELQSKFRRIDGLIKHSVSKGNYHESILKEILRNFLTKRYSIKTGFIYLNGEVSDQLDLMIIDENNPMTYIFQEGDFAIVYPHSVVTVIEVKTVLNTTTFDQAIKNIASVKKFNSSTNTGITNIQGIILGFESEIEFNKNNLNSWFKRQSCVDNKKLSPEVIFFRRKGLLVRGSPIPDFDVSTLSYNVFSKTGSDNKSDGLFARFIFEIVNKCEFEDSSSKSIFPKQLVANLREMDFKIKFGDGSV
jgi:hypothetical protein